MKTSKKKRRKHNACSPSFCSFLRLRLPLLFSSSHLFSLSLSLSLSSSLYLHTHDQLHYLLNHGAEVNQRDGRGWTPLHRAAHLAHYEGYLEVYDYLLSRGADPEIRTKNFDPYLDPGFKTVLEVCVDDELIRSKLQKLVGEHAGVEKKGVPHRDMGCWWALYDYGLERVRSWGASHRHPYPERVARERERQERRARREARRAKQGMPPSRGALLDGAPSKKAESANGKKVISVSATATATSSSSSFPSSSSSSSGPSSSSSSSAFQPSSFSTTLKGTAALFPGQGAQSVGMLSAKVAALPAVAKMLRAAEEILGYDLESLMKGGPKERLDDTAVAQPALFVAGLAAVEKARAEARESEIYSSSSSSSSSSTSTPRRPWRAFRWASTAPSSSPARSRSRTACES